MKTKSKRPVNNSDSEPDNQQTKSSADSESRDPESRDPEAGDCQPDKEDAFATDMKAESEMNMTSGSASDFRNNEQDDVDDGMVFRPRYSRKMTSSSEESEGCNYRSRGCEMDPMLTAAITGLV